MRRPSHLDVFWTDPLLGRVHPRRGGVAVPLKPLLTPQKAWSLVREDFQKKASSGAEQSRALVARLAQDSPSIGTPEEDAVLLTSPRHKERRNDKPPRTEPAVDLLFTLGGPVHATRAALLSLDLGLVSGHLGALPRVRALLATQTSDVDYLAARDAAALLRSTPEQRAAAAFLFPTEGDWVEAEIQVLSRRGHGQLVLASLSSRAQLQPLVLHLDVWRLLEQERDYLATLLDGLGAELASELAAMLVSRTSEGRPMKAWAEAMASIDTDEAMEHLLRRPEEAVSGALTEAALRWPQRAARLLPRWALLDGAEGALSRTLLAMLLKRAPEAVHAALADLSDAERARVETLQRESAPHIPEAPVERLPAVLASPPWLAGARAESLAVLADVQTPRLEDALTWAPGEREDWAQPTSLEESAFADFTEAEWRRLETKLGPELSDEDRQDVFEGDFFAYAPRALALQHLDEMHPTPWLAQWIRVVVTRLGLDVLPALERCADALWKEVPGVFAPFAAQRLAPRVAEAFHGKRLRAPARDWLLRHPAHATAGLLAPALGKPGKEQDAARAALRLLATHGHEARVLDVAARASPQPHVREAVARLLAVDPVNLVPTKRPKRPDWLGLEKLPPVLLADRATKLPPPAVDALVTLLSLSTLDEPHAGLEQVKAACDPTSLARFAWALFESWLQWGAANKDVWAFMALGPLGDDETARKLAPLLRQWPGESAHARAVMGVEVLAAIGTDVTLVYLNGIAEKVKFKGLQHKAQEKIQRIAEARGFTREELADRLVPDLGLDAHGSLTLDFGPRAFTVGFDEQLEPFVRDASGARLKGLPKPHKSDDARKAEAAAERWKALKQDAKAIASLQLMRLEWAMCARRRWSPEVFRQFFVGHPLLIHGVRRLVWGTYSPEGRLRSTFRVAEDRACADVNDDPFTLPEGVQVGLPHALELDAKTAGAWGQVFADYQLLQPFVQLGRPTHTPTAKEKTATRLERVAGLTVPTGKVLGLSKRGWRRGPPLDGGVVRWMEKPLGPQWLAELQLEEGLSTGDVGETPEQTLGAVRVRPARQGWSAEHDRPLGALDAVVFSELVHDLEGLRPA